MPDFVVYCVCCKVKFGGSVPNMDGIYSLN